MVFLVVVGLLVATACQGDGGLSEKEADEVFAEEIGRVLDAHVEEYSIDPLVVRECAEREWSMQNLGDKRNVAHEVSSGLRAPLPTWVEIAAANCWQFSAVGFDELMGMIWLMGGLESVGPPNTFEDPVSKARIRAVPSPTYGIGLLEFSLSKSPPSPRAELGFVINVLERASMGSWPPATYSTLIDAVVARQTRTIADSFTVCFQPHESFDVVVVGSAAIACA